MLYRFLAAMQNGEMHSLSGIARELGIPLGMAMQIAQDLAGKGYLSEAGSDCETPQNACADCPVTSACHIPTRYWSLADKGKRALETMAKTI